MEPATFDARWYSRLHTGCPGDIDYYTAAVSVASSVLELGCGSGRITLPIAKSGRAITGVDSSTAMLSLLADELKHLDSASQSRVWAICADMRFVDLGRRFDKVIIPYNGLLCLLSDEDVIK